MSTHFTLDFCIARLATLGLYPQLEFRNLKANLLVGFICSDRPQCCQSNFLRWGKISIFSTFEVKLCKSLTVALFLQFRLSLLESPWHVLKSRTATAITLVVLGRFLWGQSSFQKIKSLRRHTTTLVLLNRICLKTHFHFKLLLQINNKTLGCLKCTICQEWTTSALA